jgi:hypothetical protein
VALSEDVSRIASVAAQHRAPGQQVVAVLAVETSDGDRIYLAVTSRERVREAASIAALVEVAEEAADRIAEGPRLASLPYLDSIGGDSSIAGALPAVEELTRDVEQNYQLELTD